MNFNDGTTKRDLDKNTTAVDGSHESPGQDEAEQHKIDQSAMHGAQRATNRIHQNEQESPDSTIFTK